jgi:hypothetical protein
VARAAAALIAALATALLATGAAAAAGGDYALDGGTPAEQAEVRAALAASAFDWSLVPAQITIHVRRGLATSYATPGQIWLDADLLDSGPFSWGTVQMEYAHQVHFYLLDDAERAQLTADLGAKAWCWDRPGLAHADNACERFAATLTWAYWPSPQNVLQPSRGDDESASMPAGAFRALLSRLLGRGAGSPVESRLQS